MALGHLKEQVLLMGKLKRIFENDTILGNTGTPITLPVPSEGWHSAVTLMSVRGLRFRYNDIKKSLFLTTCCALGTMLEALHIVNPCSNPRKEAFIPLYR